MRVTTPLSRTARRPLAAAATLVLALVLGACSAPPKQQTPVDDVATSASGTGESGPEGFEEFYGQSLAWEDCGAGCRFTASSISPAVGSCQESGARAVAHSQPAPQSSHARLCP